MSEDESRNALDQAMADALESVEAREREHHETPEADENESPNGAADEQKELKEQLLRLAADFDNYRKRARREVDEAKNFGTESLLRDVLPVLDNFDRALASSQDEDHPLVQGLRMVRKQFVDVLDQHGVKGFDSEGQVFDPELHEALSQMISEELEPGTVVNEHERGYMLRDRLLRPAKVVVAMRPIVEETEAVVDVGEEE